MEDVGKGLVVDEETGEILETPQGEPALVTAAHLFDEAQRQEKLWSDRKKVLQQVLIANMREKKELIGGFEVAVRERQVAKQKTANFAAQASGIPLEVDQIFDIIASANSFSKAAVDRWPEELRDLLARNTEYEPSRPWVDLKPIRKVL